MSPNSWFGESGGNIDQCRIVFLSATRCTTGNWCWWQHVPGYVRRTNPWKLSQTAPRIFVFFSTVPRTMNSSATSRSWGGSGMITSRTTSTNICWKLSGNDWEGNQWLVYKLNKYNFIQGEIFLRRGAPFLNSYVLCPPVLCVSVTLFFSVGFFLT